jgi:hypothetical protein
LYATELVSASRNKEKSCLNKTIPENAELAISAENSKFVNIINVDLPSMPTLLLLGMIYTLKLK